MTGPEGLGGLAQGGLGDETPEEHEQKADPKKAGKAEQNLGEDLAPDSERQEEVSIPKGPKQGGVDADEEPEALGEEGKGLAVKDKAKGAAGVDDEDAEEGDDGRVEVFFRKEKDDHEGGEHRHEVKGDVELERPGDGGVVDVYWAFHHGNVLEVAEARLAGGPAGALEEHRDLVSETLDAGGGPEEVAEVAKLDVKGVKGVDLVCEAVHHGALDLLLEGAKNPVPDDEDAGVVPVDAVRVASMVNAVVAGSVNKPLNGAELGNGLGVNPVLEDELTKRNWEGGVG